MSIDDSRKHSRYSTSLPIAFSLSEVVASESAYLNNISISGMSFNSMVALEPGTVIMLHFPVSKPVFSTPGLVVWCRKMAFQYGIGVGYIDVDEDFRLRMVEVVRKIEIYRRQEQRTGRAVSGQDATIEWFALFGAEFFSGA
jgi:hypothetical protein